MTPNLRALIEDMVETMRHANGVGLAAPQVGVLKRLVVIECEEEELHVLINPEIIARDGEQTGYEGCLSVPGKTGIVTRPNHVKVKALNENMEPVTVEGEELLARALCHELDHLDGHLYTEMAEELYTNEELEAMQAEEDEDEA
jgi:peptide deformylase